MSRCPHCGGSAACDCDIRHRMRPDLEYMKESELEDFWEKIRKEREQDDGPRDD